MTLERGCNLTKWQGRIQYIDGKQNAAASEKKEYRKVCGWLVAMDTASSSVSSFIPFFFSFATPSLA